MNYDPEFLLHQMEEALRTGFAEEMVTAIEDVLLAIKEGDLMFIRAAEMYEEERTADGLSIRDETPYEDLDELDEWEVDFVGQIEYGKFTDDTELSD